MIEPESGARPYGAAASTTASHFTPAPVRAQPSSGWMTTSSSSLVVTSSSVVSSAIGPWPVACGVTRMPWRAANCTASTTSWASKAARTAAGWTGTARFHGETRASYAVSPGTATVPIVSASSSANGTAAGLVWAMVIASSVGSLLTLRRCTRMVETDLKPT